MLKSLHIMLAYLTLISFVVRGMWSIAGSPLRNQKWVKIAPHVIDTLLLTLGVVMAINIGASLFDGWLGAKLLGLLAYIGFGVVTMRANSRGVKLAAFFAALVCVGYMFAVAFTRSAWPLASL